MQRLFKLRQRTQALASPLSGFLGDALNRVHITCAGTVLWGAMTAAIGASRTLPEVRPGMPLAPSLCPV